MIWAVLLAVVAAAVPASPARAAREIVDLGPTTAFQPLAINNSRVIVSGDARDGAGNAYRPRLWADGQFVSVPLMDASYPNQPGGLLDINDAGLVVGFQTANFGAPTQLFEEPRAFTWQFDPAASTPAPLTVLQEFGGWGPISIPYAVNNAGDVVGLARESQGAFDPFGGNAQYDRAVIWRHGSALLSRLETGQQNTPGDPHQGYAIAINDSGTILGVNGAGALNPVRWDPIPLSNAFQVGPTAARSPETNANHLNGQGGHPLNNRGDYITANTGGTTYWRVYAADGTSKPLPTGFQGRSIADNGRVVGVMGGKATLIEPLGIPVDLNTLLPAGSPFSSLTTADDINDAGDVIGIGLVGGVQHGYLLKADAWVVNDTGDKPDTDTSDGQCLTDEGHCTLRAAIQEVNKQPGSAATTIAFSITGDPTIAPQSALPAITRANVVIDGTTQPGGFAAIDGGAVTGQAGLKLRASGITVKGMHIAHFADGPAILAGTVGGPVTGVVIGAESFGNDQCPKPCNTFDDNDGAVTVLDPGSKVRVFSTRMTGDGPVPIDVGGNGRTPNDRGDLDAAVNFPVGVTGRVDPITGDLHVSGALTSRLGQVDIDVYAQPSPGSPAAAGPARYLGDTETSATGAFDLRVPKADVDAGARIFSATATVGGETSELSPVCGDPIAAGDPDADRDGLCDSWELNGFDYDDDGTADLQFPGAATDRRDLYLEVDAMKAPDGHQIAPTQGALDQVVQAFDRSPVDGQGIALHIQRDEDDVPYVNPIAYRGSGPTSIFGVRFGSGQETCTGAFGTKAERAAPSCWAVLGAKRLTTRHAVFGDDYSMTEGGPVTGSSGIADGIGGGGLIVTEATGSPHFKILAGGGPSSCTTVPACAENLDAVTLMHEFGHLLGLRHGGGDNTNYKPNYLSIMNYGFQFANRTPDRPLDYSRWKLPDLDTGALDENAGILGGQTFGDLATRWPHTNHTTDKGGTCRAVNVPSTGHIDFDLDGAFSGGAGAPIADGGSAEAGLPTCLGSGSPLEGFEDWGHLRYAFRDGQGFQRAAGDDTATDPPVDTEAAELAVAARMDSNGDGVSNYDATCAVIPGAPDANGNGVLDDCERPAGGGGVTPGGVPSSQARDRTPPRITKLKLSPARFAVPRKAGRRPATKLTLSLSEPATVNVLAERLTKGRRKGRACLPKLRRGKPCTVAVRQRGTVVVKAARAGVLTIALSGRFGGRALAPGRYALVVTARDAAGNTTQPVRVSFTVR